MKPIRNEQSRTQDLQKVVTVEQSIRDFRKAYPELSNHKLALEYQRRYRVSAKRVFDTLAKMNQPTGGSIA